MAEWTKVIKSGTALSAQCTGSQYTLLAYSGVRGGMIWDWISSIECRWVGTSPITIVRIKMSSNRKL